MLFPWLRYERGKGGVFDSALSFFSCSLPVSPFRPPARSDRHSLKGPTPGAPRPTTPRLQWGSGYRCFAILQPPKPWPPRSVELKCGLFCCVKNITDMYLVCPANKSTCFGTNSSHSSLVLPHRHNDKVQQQQQQQQQLPP